MRRPAARGMALVSVLVLCALAAACGSGPAPWADGPPRAYSDAEVRFLLKDYRGALDKFEAFLINDPDSRYASDAHYWAGVCALELGDLQKARAYVKRAWATPRIPFLKGLCLGTLGDCDFADGEYRSAVANYRRALEYPGARRDRILYRVGQCYLRIGADVKAEKCFERLVQEYPSSEFAARAKGEKPAMPAGSGGDFTVQAGAFGSRGNAEHLRSRLEKRGFTSHLRLLNKGGKVLYSVRVGRYATSKEAEAVARRMKAAGFDATVVP